MKWLIGPRRIGKTTQIHKLLMQEKRDCVFVTFSTQAAKQSEELFCQEYGIKKTNGLYIESNGKKVYFCGFQDYINHFAQNFERHPTYIDNLDQILPRMFGNLIAASATGPNYDWHRPKWLGKSELERLKRELSQEQYENEFGKYWRHK